MEAIKRILWAIIEWVRRIKSLVILITHQDFGDARFVVFDRD